MGQHLDDLERFYDGHVPDHLRAWARRQDALAAAPDYRPPPARIVLPRAARACVGIMAPR